MKSPYTPIGTLKRVSNPETELRDEIIVVVATLIILSLVIEILWV